MSETNLILLFLLLAFLIGSALIEISNRGRKKGGGYFVEKRRTRKITALEPLGTQILAEVSTMLNEEKLNTRSGLKMLMKLMSETYVADVQRTMKVNEITEQFEILRSKNVVIWIEERPKLALALTLLFFGWTTDELRIPLLREALSRIGISLP